MIDIIFTNRLNQTDLDVIECGTQECPPNYSFGPAIRDLYMIHFIHSGKGYFRLGNEEFYLKAGDAFVIWPNTVTYYCADLEEPWHYSWVGFSGTKAEFYLSETALTIESPTLKCTVPEFVGQYFKDMMKTRNLLRSREIHLLGIFYLLLSHLVENVTDVYGYKPSSLGKLDYMDKSVEFIKSNYSKKISILDIAKHVGIDRKYLCTLFKKALKTSPHRFLLNIRMDKACELMYNKYLSIGDISRSVGYEDSLLFSKMFKRYKGLSPSKFRKSFVYPIILKQNT